jgi:hypothetical protein
MSTRELSGITPFRVHEHFINSFVIKWEEISLDAFRDVELIFNSVVDELLKRRFGRFKSSMLLYNVRF